VSRRTITLRGALWAACAPRDAYLWACMTVLATAGTLLTVAAAAVTQ
jgi:hypothetical protein